MNGLQEYISSSEYSSLQGEIKRWRRVLHDSLRIFGYFPTHQPCWSYKLPINPDENTMKSSSTTSMILFTIARCLGSLDSYGLVVHGKENLAADMKQEDRERLEIAFKRGLCRLVEYVSNEVFALTSKTWGKDDPLTLCWLLELDNLSQSSLKEDVSRYDSFFEKVREIAKNRVEGVLLKPGESILEYAGKDAQHHAARHSLPILKIAHLWNRLSKEEDYKLDSSKIFDHCMQRVYHQLAIERTEFGRFDAGELIFATESAIIFGESATSVDLDLLSCIFSVISKRQHESVYWRPIKPLWHTPQGTVMLPLSVEIANSILRIYTAMQDEEIAQVWGDAETPLEIARRYARWLETRIQSIRLVLYSPLDLRKKEEDQFCGWASEHLFEHIGREKIIHPWETAQAVLFLADLIEMLDQFLARKMRGKAGLHLKEKRDNNEETDPEPLLSLKTGDDYSESSLSLLPYVVMEKRMIHNGRNGNHKRIRSMLLYGPSGTGKTTFAARLADKLRCDLLTITPSHFIAGGIEQVEAKATAIFKMLEQQRNVVLLLDEIDRLIHDRDHPDYKQQGDMFQAMTPSMLDKLHCLRDRDNIPFIIATNYKERIDSAILRVGRIDICCLLAPPDQIHREGILRRELNKQGKNFNDDDVQQLAAQSSLMTTGELKREIESIPDDLGNYSEILGKCLRTITLESYRSRFDRKELDNRQKPLVEFLTLLALRQEAHDVLSEQSGDRKLRYSNKEKNVIYCAMQSVSDTISTHNDGSNQQYDFTNLDREIVEKGVKEQLTADLIIGKVMKAFDQLKKEKTDHD